MEKVVVVAYAADEASPLDADAVRRLNEHLREVLEPARYPGLGLQVEEHDATLRWQRRERPAARRVALVLSAWTDCGDEVENLVDALGPAGDDHDAFVVTESVPRWEMGPPVDSLEPRPGYTVTSLLCRNPAMTRDEFVAHWRDVHQPMSLRIHPQRTYARNVVARTLTPWVPPVDAICEEGFLSLDDILDPSRFFGADPAGASWQDAAGVIGADVRLFLDTDHTVATITRDFRLRTFPRG
jgi:EthD domain